MSKPLVIFGSAEIAELAKFYFENDSNRKVVAFTVDDIRKRRPVQWHAVNSIQRCNQALPC